MEFRILGPVEALADGASIALGGTKQRALLAVLLLHANDVVSIDRLIDALWDEPPANATKAVQVYASRLRKALGGGIPAGRSGGYVLVLEPEQLDLARFRRLVGEARRDRSRAAEVLEQALALWRGPALAEFANEPFARVERLRLEELRLEAVEERIEEELALGRHAALIGELEALVAEHPSRERLRGQLMLALYRSGRQAEALATYRDGRRSLLEELGIDPGRELQQLELAILRQDAGLDLEQPRPVAAMPDHEVEPAAAAAADGPVEERKVVSVLFVDLVGFTARAERSDPEDVRAALRPFHATAKREIEQHGGTIEKYIGDAVMAVFGAPAVHEDDAERAVRAGLRIVEAIEEMNRERPDLALEVRVGVNTGEAIVALGARPEHGEGIVAGDVVNTAARIQSVAPVDGVAVGGQTYGATARVFEYEPLEPIAVKGKAGPLELWRAIRPLARFGSDIVRRYGTPFVGRQLEKPVLIGAFERAAQQRSVQMVTIIGEPGVGKTRLVGELFAYIVARPGITRWRQGRCLPYGEGITFWALGEIVKAEAGILESDSATAAAAKLEAAVSEDDAERGWLLQRLSPLLGIEAGTPAERQELFTAWRRFLERLAATRPTVLVFEDLQWGDDALLAFLEHLAEWSEGVPLLLLCTARPELYEQHPTFGAAARNSQRINLAPLSEEETSLLIAALSERRTLPAPTQEALLERAGGNPLYAEEFVRLLADRGQISGDAWEMPESVLALIAARLDTLTPEDKSLLQDAAVLGKVFWAGGIADIGGHDLDQVELMLHGLARKELVRPARTSSIEGESEFAFWHGLVRDVAYAQIPRAERVRRHRAAAAWIERKAGERIEDVAEVLAHHSLQALELAQAAGDTGQAADLSVPTRRFLVLAAERAMGLDQAHAEARLARALELTPAEDPERTELLLRWADVVFQAGRPREAVETVDEVIASGCGQQEVVARALQLRSRIAMRLGEPHVALATEAVELFEKTTPGPETASAYSQLANAQFIAGDYPAAIAAAERALELADELGLPQPARALGYRGMSRVYFGDAEGIRDMEDALALLLAQGAAQDAAVVLNNLPVCGYLLHGPAESLAAFETAVAFCRERGLEHAATVSDVNCPGLLAELGRPREALERCALLTAAAEAMGDSYSLIELGAVDLTVRLALGEAVSPTEAEELAGAARDGRGIDNLVLGLAAAAAVLAGNAPERALALLGELEANEAAPRTTYYVRQLSAMSRTALAARDPALARRLADALEPRYPVDEYALTTVRAQLAEFANDLPGAAALYAEAAENWRTFPNLPERAGSLLGQGRCLLALGARDAKSSLDEARDLFESMGYKPALAETVALIGP